MNVNVNVNVNVKKTTENLDSNSFGEFRPLTFTPFYTYTARHFTWGD